jgi:hypothetical protein
VLFLVIFSILYHPLFLRGNDNLIFYKYIPLSAPVAARQGRQGRRRLLRLCQRYKFIQVKIY